MNTRYKLPPITRKLVKKLIAEGRTELAREIVSEQFAFERQMRFTAQIVRAILPLGKAVNQ
jgi:hypothetical protein